MTIDPNRSTCIILWNRYNREKHEILRVASTHPSTTATSPKQYDTKLAFLTLGMRGVNLFNQLMLMLFEI